MNGEKLMGTPLFRGLIAGYPGAGKTGSLASLANAGFKLRILNFDKGNAGTLLPFVQPEFRRNVDILDFEDKFTLQGAVLAPVGMPTAFANSWKALDSWKYEAEDGVLDEKTGKRWIDLGASKDWGSDVIVVLDGTTGHAAAAMDYARAAMNKTVLNTTRSVWGVAASNQEAFLKRLASAGNKHHVIVIAHQKIIGPEAEADGESDYMKTIKEEKAALIPTKLFPTGVGRQLPQHIAGHFPICIAAEVRTKGKTVSRLLSAMPREDQTTKLPVLQGLGELPIETGMLTIFDAMGIKRP